MRSSAGAGASVAGIMTVLSLLGCGRLERAAPLASAAAEPEPPKKSGPVDPVRVWVKIGKDDIATERGIVVPLPEAEKRAAGVDAKHKRSGAADVHIVPLAAAIPSCHDRTVTIEVEPTTPFRLLEEVAFTLAEQGCKSFEARVIDDRERRFTFTTPVHADVDGAKLLAEVKDTGVSLTTPDGAVGPGCEAGAAGVTVARQGDGFPAGALTLCATKLKGNVKALATSRLVVLAAAPATPCAEVADAVRALERHGAEPLFPDVVLGAPP